MERGLTGSSKRAVAALVVGLLIMSACSDDGTDTSDASVSSSRIVVALTTEPEDLDPHVVATNPPDSQYFEQLVMFTQDRTFAPLLAAEMPTQVDDTTWEVALRGDVEFHDGTPMDAEAVVASFKELQGTANAAEEAIDATWTSFDVVDDHTMRISLSAPDPLLPSKLAFIHVVKAGNSDAADHPIGTGPFEFSQWKRGQSLVLDRFDGYWGDAPQIETLEYRFIPEESTQLAAFKAGEVDVLFEVSSTNAEQLDEENLTITQSGEAHQLNLNARAGITSDVRVRKAMNLAVDRNALNDLFGGSAEELQCQVLQDGYAGFNEDIEAYPYDPEEARRLIEESGVAGAKVEIVTSNGRWENDREQAEAIASMWSDVGLDATPRVLGTADEYLAAILDQSSAEARPTAFFVSAGTEVLDGGGIASSSFLPPDPAGTNPSSVLAETASAWRRASETPDPDARSAAWKAFFADVCDDALFVNLLSPPVRWGHSDKIESLNPLPIVKTNWLRMADTVLAD